MMVSNTRTFYTPTPKGGPFYSCEFIYIFMHTLNSYALGMHGQSLGTQP